MTSRGSAPYGNPGHVHLGPPCRQGTDGLDRTPRQAGDDRQRQRDGADLERDPEVVRGAEDRMALHRPRTADAEQLCGKLQRQAARRVSLRGLVPQPGPCPRTDQRLGH